MSVQIQNEWIRHTCWLLHESSAGQREKSGGSIPVDRQRPEWTAPHRIMSTFNPARTLCHRLCQPPRGAISKLESTPTNYNSARMHGPLHTAFLQNLIRPREQLLLLAIIFAVQNLAKCWTKVLLNQYGFAHRDSLVFVWRQNYNHPISGMAAFFAVHARTFLSSLLPACLYSPCPDRPHLTESDSGKGVQLHILISSPTLKGFMREISLT